MRRRSSPRGFTMVELMFALMILTIVLLGLVSVLGSVLRTQSEGRTVEKVSVAANMLFGQATQALAEHFDRPLVPDVFPAGRQPVPNVEGIYYEISDSLEAGHVDLKRVNLKLFWKDHADIDHEKAMMTKVLKAR